MPPTTDEIDAAAGRLRRLAAGEHADAVYAGMGHLGGAAFFVTRDTGTLAAAWLARPVTVPVATPEEVQAARDRIGRVICDDESREAVYGDDWRPKAKADMRLSHAAAVQQSRLKDPVYQQGYNDGLLAALGVPAASPTATTPKE